MAFDDAYQLQLARWRADLDGGSHRIGWKIGLNPPKVLEALSLDEPIVGHLTSGTLIGADGSHNLAGAETPKAEPEIAIEVGPDDTVAGVAPAIEVVDIPSPPSSHEEVHDAIATNIFHRAVLIGPSKSPEELAGAEATFTLSGETVGTADLATVDLEGTVALVARTLAAAGESLQVGDRIIAGALMPPPDVSAGDLITLDAGPLGSVQIAFS